MTASGIEIYSAFIAAELKIESDRRESVHNRAGTLVTSSAGLITLALGVFGLLAGKDVEFPGVAIPFFVAAVAGLLVSGSFAVAAGIPSDQNVVKDATLAKMLVEHHADPADVAHYSVAYTNSMGLVSLRRGTNKKAKLLVAAGISQILAILLIGISVWLVVLHHGRNTCHQTNPAVPAAASLSPAIESAPPIVGGALLLAS